MTDDKTENLFSYGTLREEKVQLSVFGRKLEGRDDSITGYRLERHDITHADAIAISGTNAHTILHSTGNVHDQIEGRVFRITKKELQLADDYEDASYTRVAARLLSGGEAWVYVKA